MARWRDGRLTRRTWPGSRGSWPGRARRRGRRHPGGSWWVAATSASRGAVAPLLLDGEPVGCWLRTRQGVKPVAVHAAWRTDVATAVEVVLAATRRPARTPEPLRRARTAARVARAARS